MFNFKKILSVTLISIMGLFTVTGCANLDQDLQPLTQELNSLPGFKQIDAKLAESGEGFTVELNLYVYSENDTVTAEQIKQIIDIVGKHDLDTSTTELIFYDPNHELIEIKEQCEELYPNSPFCHFESMTVI